jgi:hypothetical protein
MLTISVGRSQLPRTCFIARTRRSGRSCRS